MVVMQADVANVFGVQAGLVGDGAYDFSGADAMGATDVETIAQALNAVLLLSMVFPLLYSDMK